MKDNTNQRIVLLTGATGFIGSHLTKKLTEENWEVHILIRQHSKIDILGPTKSKINIHTVTSKFEDLKDLLKKINPTCVIHLASLFIAEHRPEQTNELIRSNIEFPTQLLEAMRLANITSLVNTGTSWQHYQNSSYNPVNLYAATKQAFETIIDYYVEAHGFKVCTLKLFDTYGPNDHRKKIVSLLKNLVIHDDSLDMSPGNQLIDLVHINDVISAYLIAANKIKSPGGKHEKYGISSKQQITLRDLVELIEKITNQKLNIRWGVRPYRNREVLETWEKFNELPNWKPQISLEDGLKEIFLSNQI